jgi:hypothetical protein
VNSLVIFESMFGNTRSIALAIAEGLSSRMTTQVEEVGAAADDVGAEVELLVVGGPTHAFSMSRPNTRLSAAAQAHRELVSKGIGLREWLIALRIDGATVAAAFDTRIDKPRLPGSAAKAAAKLLRRKKLELIAPAESFYVAGTDGPLLDGEIERARRWGAELASACEKTTVRPLLDNRS